MEICQKTTQSQSSQLAIFCTECTRREDVTSYSAKLASRLSSQRTSRLSDRRLLMLQWTVRWREWFEQFNIGTVCAPEEEIESAVKNILSEPIGKGRYEIAREQLMGIDQVKQLGAALKGEDWSRFPEFDFRR